MRKVVSSAIAAFVLCLLCEPLLAQSRVSDSHSRTEANDPDRDPDHVIERQQWFRRGRQGVQGRSAAALRLDAYQQMVARRKAAHGDAKQDKPQPAGGSFTTSQTWSLLGPSPILSNLSGSATADYDYGPVVGRVTALFVDPSDATGNTVYLGGATGGLWRSTSAAATTPTAVMWTPLLDSQPTLSVGAIGIQPGNSHLIILGTGEPDFSIDSYYALGLLRSTDQGSTWSLISTAVSGPGGVPIDLKGVAFSSVVFSADNPNLVVAGAGASGVGFGDRIETVTDSRFGIYYSTDTGQTWTAATFQDGTIPIAPWSVSSIVYNPIQHLFYASVGFQGIYSSSDGATWTRLASQPGTGLNLANCPGYFATSCPIFRGTLAVRPGADEMYAWYVDINSNDQGIYKTVNGGQTWTALSETGITNCGDSEGCGTEQGFFNLVLSAVPQANGGTDLYAGAVNLFKCSITSANPTCSTHPFLNLSHVYGCSPVGSIAHVHPDQHAIAFASGNPQIVYFGNDGGIYRSLNGSSLSSGACGTPNSFDNLNPNMGSMTQFVWLSEDPGNEQILLGGTQDNGSPARTTAVPAWPEVNLGDGGYNAINPSSPNEWFTSHTDVSIERCTVGTNCTPATFTSVVTSTTLSGDVGAFYTPYLLDPQAPSKMIVGTCRLWRGPSSGGTGWTPISNNFDTSNNSVCAADSQNQIQAIAAGGAVTPHGSQAIWAGTSTGTLYYTSNADGGSSTWLYHLETNSTPISSIAIDPKDPTGQTAYYATQEFLGNQIKLVAPNTVTQAAGDLPNIPVNSIIFDPEFPNIMYAGTDIGVFESDNAGTNWLEVGPATLPSAPVSHLEVFYAAGVKKLRASTYGRGVWETPLATGSIPLVSFSNTTLSFSAQPVGTTSAPGAVTLTNIGSSPLNVTGYNLSSTEFAQTNNCPAALAAGANCTIGVTFTPISSGNHQATLTLVDNAYDSPQEVQLIGNLPVPALNVDNSQLRDFGGVAIGVISGTQVVNLRNFGTGALNISNLTATGDFLETDNCGKVLQILDYCQISVSFRPTASGPRTGILLITDDAPNSPQTVPLSGTGVAELALSNATIGFPNVPVGQSSSPIPVTLSNFTSSAIKISQMTFTWPNFTQTNTCGASVAPQATCVVNITFTPTQGGIMYGSFSVIDTNGNTVSAPINGTGIDFAVTSPGYNISITAGQTASFPVTALGYGGFTGVVSFTCQGGPKGSTCTTSPASVSLNSSNDAVNATVNVTTVASSAIWHIPSSPISYGNYFVSRLTAALLLMFAAMLWSMRRRAVAGLAIPRALVLAFLFGVQLLAVSCGGGSASTTITAPPPPPPPTNYSIVVTGTSGSLSHSMTVVIAVTP